MFTEKKFSEIIDMTVEEFNDLIEKSNLTLGETLSLKSLLTVQYNQMNLQKNALLEKHNEPDTTEDIKEQIVSTVKAMLVKMMSIEYKVCVLNNRVYSLTKDV